MKKLTKNLGLISLLVSAGVVGIAACGSDDDDTTAPPADAGADVTSQDTGTGGGDAARDSGEMLTDGQIFQYLHEANLGEVAEAKVAEMSATTSVIKNVATEFDSAHSMADTALQAAASADGIVAADSDLSTALESSVITDEQEYDSLNGASFDATYLRNQTNAHTMVLATINNVLLPQVRDAGLKAQVQAAQTMVAMHLAELQGIEADGGVDAGGAEDSGLDRGDAGDAGKTADASDAADGS